MGILGVLPLWWSVRVFMSDSCLRLDMAEARVPLRVGVRFHGPRPRRGGAVSSFRRRDGMMA